MRWGCVALVAAGLFAGSVSEVRAADTSKHAYEPCRGGTAPQDKVVACEKRELAGQDKALNAAYSKLYAVFSVYQRERLRAAERAWVRFREADCESEGLQISGGPQGIIASGQVEDKADCLLKTTHERVVLLEQRYQEAWDGGARPRR